MKPRTRDAPSLLASYGFAPVDCTMAPALKRLHTRRGLDLHVELTGLTRNAIHFALCENAHRRVGLDLFD